mmetsp:Transcript_28648/g.55906  ORF Transcript_28648/g.55906 Transcript_28648/m.55906 type:complete len:254 (-) Transcript_28648:1346-2107(-)
MDHSVSLLMSTTLRSSQISMVTARSPKPSSTSPSSTLTLQEGCLRARPRAPSPTWTSTATARSPSSSARGLLLTGTRMAILMLSSGSGLTTPSSTAPSRGTFTRTGPSSLSSIVITWLTMGALSAAPSPTLAPSPSTRGTRTARSISTSRPLSPSSAPSPPPLRAAAATASTPPTRGSLCGCLGTSLSAFCGSPSSNTSQPTPTRPVWRPSMGWGLLILRPMPSRRLCLRSMRRRLRTGRAQSRSFPTTGLCL